MGDCKVCIPCNQREERGKSYLQRSFSNHLISAALHAILSAPLVVIRLALQISCATLTAALLLWIAPSADMTELAARVKSKASSGFSK
jgi:hypothetical protein